MSHCGYQKIDIRTMRYGLYQTLNRVKALGDSDSAVLTPFASVGTT